MIAIVNAKLATGYRCYGMQDAQAFIQTQGEKVQ